MAARRIFAVLAPAPALAAGAVRHTSAQRPPASEQGQRGQAAMAMTHPLRAVPRWARPFVLAALMGVGLPVAACDLDGLSHGYGPMSALFAGAHRYQSLNGLEDEASPPEPPPEPADEATANADASSPPPTPARSFVAWARAKPKDPGAAEAPAAWVPRGTSPSADPSSAAPEGAEPERGEQEQRRPGGGPVP